MPELIKRKPYVKPTVEKIKLNTEIDGNEIHQFYGPITLWQDHTLAYFSQTGKYGGALYKPDHSGKFFKGLDMYEPVWPQTKSQIDNTRGLIIDAIKSKVSGVMTLLLTEAEKLARKANVKYIALETHPALKGYNKVVTNIKEKGYVLIGKGNMGYEYYVKIL